MVIFIGASICENGVRHVGNARAAGECKRQQTAS
jgi:hypothetical protein